MSVRHGMIGENMKVVNISLIAYSDGWSYQDNLLPKYQHKLGNDVWIITTNKAFGKNGELIEVDQQRYVSDDGVNIIRLKEKEHGIYSVFDSYRILPELKEIQPDYIFFHSLNFFSIWDSIKYIQKYNEKCVLVVDNHQDKYNFSTSKLSIRGQIMFFLNKVNSRLFARYIDKAFGVTAGRVDYLTEVYGIPKEKTELLLMGVDSDAVFYEKRQDLRLDFCEKNHVDQSDFLLLTGGKLDSQKKIIELMDAFCGATFSKSVKLVIFGSVATDIKEAFYEKLNNTDIIYMGFLDSQRINELFVLSDLGVFIGGHSVLWEQAIGCGLPCIFQHHQGMEHVNVGENCAFITGDNISDIQDILENYVNDEKKYRIMKKNAVEKGMRAFSYYEIAKKSLSVTKNKG